jgi:hypothetical protein
MKVTNTLLGRVVVEGGQVKGVDKLEFQRGAVRR